MRNASLAETLINSRFAGKVGIPQGAPLRRYQEGEPPLAGPVVIGGSGRLSDGLREALQIDYQLLEASADSQRSAAVFDATGIESPAQLRELYDFFHPQIKKLGSSSRLLVIGTTPEQASGVQARIAARALEGFTRSLAKEMRKGGTVNLVYAAPDAQVADLESTVRFFLSGKSAFVDGQVVRVGSGAAALNDAPLANRLAVVTGAARGIGAVIAEVLARDGADVICVDISPASGPLSEVANKVKGTALPLDVTSPDAARVLAEHAEERYGRKIDVIVHNAGITRDKLLVNMNEGQWDQVLGVNLQAPVTITSELLERDALAEGASVIGVSSMAGISGNRGQTNYATTKAGIIGLVDSLREPLAERNSTINAVAPGFIETDMTAAMPTGPREVGRRLNSLQQGGLPIDVAETVAYFASAASRSVTGNTVRVCGQNVMGA
ncbi:MAG: 3-oxoacyl-ACP reductase [Corynebacterium camporealensis]|uniref:3-oxoacyl-ACP reductase n=1 Tax=Corynebacterium camporealensis TaxID=161896 RepID=UPI002A91EB70|nr:3-oxoacyl-ACP reductase [Corynebacterium camporealensis]MDY5840978.1 3-oxoacyl-ACP reductase [Corynebacterium camporealensis]